MLAEERPNDGSGNLSWGARTTKTEGVAEGSEVQTLLSPGTRVPQGTESNGGPEGRG